jgi:very-short-patch-repair endonuclease
MSDHHSDHKARPPKSEPQSSNDNYLSAIQTRQESESPHEYLWRLLQGGKLAGLHFRRNESINGVDVPFYCGLSRLVVDVDQSKQMNAKDRSKHLSSYGLSVLDVESDLLFSNPNAILSDIRRAAETAPRRIRLRK